MGKTAILGSLLGALVYTGVASGSPHIQTRHVSVTAKLQAVRNAGHTIKLRGRTYLVSAATRIGYQGAQSFQLPPSRLKPGMLVRLITPAGAGVPAKQITILPR